jgi:hypothetical protein
MQALGTIRPVTARSTVEAAKGVALPIDIRQQASVAKIGFMEWAGPFVCMDGRARGPYLRSRFSLIGAAANVSIDSGGANATSTIVKRRVAKRVGWIGISAFS